jgi:hypothetical protein
MHCGFEQAASEQVKRFEDIYRPCLRRELLCAVDARRGVGAHRYTSHFVVEQAAARFFELVSFTEESLWGRFSDAEFQVILNNTSPIESWDSHFGMASTLACDLGVESLDDLKKENPLRVLLEKLQELTPLEDAALVDVCERVSRGHDNPLLDCGE